jgi:hypothetical protein
MATNTKTVSPTPTAPSTPSSPSVQVYEKIKQLAAAEARFFKEIAEKKKELASSDVGDQLLDGYLEGRETKAENKVTTLRDEIEARERASQAARDRRRDAVLEYNKARAAEARKKAAEKIREAESLDAKAAPLLQELKALQGVDYVPKPLKPGYDSPLGAEVRSHSQRLRDDASALTLQAHEWERKRVEDRVTVEGHDTDTLVQAVMERPLVMAPPLGAIAEWVKTMRSKGEAGRLNLYINGGRLAS